MWQFFRRHPGVVLETLITQRFTPAVRTPALAREFLFSAEMPAEKVAAYHRRLQDESFRAGLDELGLNLVRPKRVRTPLLVIGAQNDTVILPKYVHATARTYGTTATIYPGMAHDVMLEAGWQTVADHILEFLKERGL